MLGATDLAGFPDLAGAPQLSTNPAGAADRTDPTGRKKAFVTGCFDWLHSGHVRFFEEVSALGDLYVAVGNDANVHFLKGEGHPLFPQAERRYMAGAIRYVTQALITSGWGWMDAAPDIARLKPDIYAVNEDGDRPEKRAFCQEHGLQYVVLKRTPKEGLPKRESTALPRFLIQHRLPFCLASEPLLTGFRAPSDPVRTTSGWLSPVYSANYCLPYRLFMPSWLTS